jgi:signal transduction histidine kinase
MTTLQGMPTARRQHFNPEGLFEANPDALVIVNAEGTCLYANGGARALFGAHAPYAMIGARMGLPVPERGGRARFQLPDGRYAELNAAPTEWEGARAWLVSMRDSQPHAAVNTRQGTRLAARASDPATPVRLAERFESALRIGREIALAMSEEAIYEKVGLGALDVLIGGHYVILLVENLPDGRMVVSPGVEDSGLPPDLISALGERALRENRSVCLPPGSSAKSSAAPHALCAPIKVRERIDSCLFVSHRVYRGTFTEDDLRLADLITTLAGAALENAIGFRQIQNLSRGLATQTTVLQRTNRDLDRSLSELSQAKDDLEALNRHLEVLVAERTVELERRAADLVLANRELEQFVHAASHDLQEPLRMIASYCELLSRRYGHALDERGLRYISYSIEGATRMKGLLESLLELSGVGAEPFEGVPVDTTRVLQAVLRSLELRLSESGGRVDVLGRLPTVRGHEAELSRLFQNLIGNSLKFRDPLRAPSVRISAERDGESWHFRVADTGIGIAPPFLERIFVAFQRLHRRGEYPGSGLGLALCKKIVERHGGRIWAESREGLGTTVHFTLPACDRAEQKPH